MSVYNGARILGRTMRGLSSQTYTDFELIIVDDGSTDDTSMRLRDFEKSDHRIRIIRKTNEGLTRALVDGCAVAKGEFIARQDCGDVSLPARLETQLAFLDAHPEVVVVGSGYELVAPSGEILETRRFTSHPLRATQDFLQHGVAPVHSGVMFRRNAYNRAGGYRPEFFCAQDHDLLHRMSAHGSIGYCEEILFQWYFERSGISAERSHWQKRLATLAAECRMAREAGGSDAELLEQARRWQTEYQAFARSKKRQPKEESADYFIGSLLLKNRDPAARIYLWNAVRSCPWSLKRWIKFSHAIATCKSAIADCSKSK